MMIDRIAYVIRNLPSGETEKDIVTYIESQSNYGELTLYASAETNTFPLTLSHLYTYQYKDYLIDVTPTNKQFYISCHKITPTLLAQKYQEVREKLSILKNHLNDPEKEIRLVEYRTRKSTKLYMENRINLLKREIRSELTRLNISIKPGSAISKLLSVSYLPEVHND